MSELSNIKLNQRDMQTKIKNAGGLFYQYRPCRPNAEMIYDIENIRHNVVYAQTPLNMNDPFDSRIGYSAEKIYQECLNMIVQALNIDDSLKMILSGWLKHRMLGKLAEFISAINALKQYLINRQVEMHQTHLDFEHFILQHSKNLYGKMPKTLKMIFPYQGFLAFASFVGKLLQVDITENVINSILNTDAALDTLYEKAVSIHDDFIVKLEEFLSTLTISCFSASGWQNQLMWSHYANSYAGICVEYDFNRMNQFIGFVYPITYDTNRPTVSLQDLGIKGYDIEHGLIYDSPNMKQIFTYLLTKNECWRYEEEWRVINIGEANKPMFVDTPFVKSITFGPKIDKMCKRLLLDVCLEKDIACYDLIVDTERFTLDRKPVSAESIEFNMDDEAQYIERLGKQISILAPLIESNVATINEGLADQNIRCDLYLKVLEEILDILSNAYYLKLTLSRVCNQPEVLESDLEIPDDFMKGVKGINFLVSSWKVSSKQLHSAFRIFCLKGFLKQDNFRKLINRLNGIDELSSKISEYPWSAKLVVAQDTNDDQI